MPRLDLPDPPLALVAVLRQSLDTILTALAFQRAMPPETPECLRCLYDPQWALDSACALLEQDNLGHEVQMQLAVHMGLALLCYEFCDYLEALEMHGLTHPQEIQASLEQVRALTVRSYGDEA